MDAGTLCHHLPQGLAWPSLPFDDWMSTQATLHRWVQIVGKVQLEAAPFLNE
jgi:hypothetical protein